MSDPLRVGIIGAGAAGLSAARSLVAAGHQVVLFEREDRVGGKCRSLEHDGRVYDLGANFTTPRYERVRALADELGLEREPIGKRQIVPVTDEEPERVGFFKGSFLRLAAWWYGQRRARTGIDQDGLGGLPPAVHQSFRDWLRSQGLGQVARVFDALFTSYGYGPVVDLPAAYAMKFFDPVHLDAAVRVIREQEVTTTTDFTTGFQSLWTRLVEQLGLDVRLSAEVVAVERSDALVTVRYLRDGQEAAERFDRIVLACPFDRALGFLDASEAERRLFSRIEHFDYRVVAAKTRGLADVSTYLFPWSQRYTPGQPMAFYKPVAGDPNEVFLFYAYGGPGQTDEELVEAVRVALAHPRFAAELDEVLHVQHWTYFPHVSVEQMQAGFYEDLEALQGQRRTWYAGELMSFPLVELVVRYSEALVARDF